MRKIELLAPAGNADIGIEAIRHGADAVYIGPPSHGARKAVANSIEDIRRLTDYAHLFGSRVYVTVNTIVFDKELKHVERMIHGLYDAGVDALIVQDMGILRLDLPPIALHASTQCDIRTPEKALFLQEAGFSQLVLARELSIGEIEEICRTVQVPVEVFVHGALCVSYSGRCSAGYACAGRSGNRGECPQICRQAFTLRDTRGKILAKDKYLLSLKDFRAENQLEALLKAGVSSFKIEGRLKEAGYVKNVTAAYSRRLDQIVRESNGEYARSSYGSVSHFFSPDLEKSFNRGFTEYRLSGKPDKEGLASIHTPKSLGENIKSFADLRPGDGISYFDRNGEYRGALVNRIEKSGIITNHKTVIPRSAEIRRTSSVEWKKLMTSQSANRSLAVDMILTPEWVEATDETGVTVRIPNSLEGEKAQKPTDHRKTFEKLGNTPFTLRHFRNEAEDTFFPVSGLTALRRSLIEELMREKALQYSREERRKENLSFPYPSPVLDYRDNVANEPARQFYTDHGVKEIEPALETASPKEAAGKTVMTSRHCILRELGLCLKTHRDLRLPLTLESGPLRLRPAFRCDPDSYCAHCEMSLSIL